MLLLSPHENNTQTERTERERERFSPEKSPQGDKPIGLVCHGAADAAGLGGRPSELFRPASMFPTLLLLLLFALPFTLLLPVFLLLAAAVALLS